MSDSITDFSTLTNLLAQVYDPRVIPDISLTVKELTDMSAAVQANCDLDKLINTITDSIGEGAATLGGRLAGASIFEFSNLLSKYRKASDNFEVGEVLGELTQIVFNWSI